ncbi:putative hemolysin|uniref:DUF333 domain-containing protein n=2 Tax=Brenneria TaxID=71655 RepID=A0AA42C2M0_9GAMM|nr:MULTISPECIES: DUF333 domain-containing protein [Brenneria]MCV9877580.1 DUF333 domain-containing protein [Brenneria izbisi]MCV9880855.1 DUF333 domain-containing protein [Brenneria izbisi]NMN91833.1 putative hemolysin [Brenneria salicis ATCC 15712 = DSM 30166]RBP59880.1 putative hemolysin [Brenneria salicis ATCC 15712 = DSM 30166]RLM29875.1 hypothetical protein BHG07_13845 [Brenneria salicis ATCC 15712 = DSM 30166]
MKGYQWLVTVAALVLAGCSGGEKAAAVDKRDPALDENSVVLLKSSTPLDVNCTLIGGTMALSRQLDGASVGTCQLANGKRCDERAVMNGTCPAG